MDPGAVGEIVGHAIDDKGIAELAAGMPVESVHRVMAEINANLPRAVGEATMALPDDCPDSVSGSIVRGIEQRGRLLEDALRAGNE